MSEDLSKNPFYKLSQQVGHFAAVMAEQLERACESESGKPIKMKYTEFLPVGIAKALYCSTDFQSCILSTYVDGQCWCELKRFQSRDEMLDWCSQNAAMLLYNPSQPFKN